jgi:hypothetical protein
MTCTCFEPSTQTLLAFPMYVQAQRVRRPLPMASCRNLVPAAGFQEGTSVGTAKMPARLVS